MFTFQDILILGGAAMLYLTLGTSIVDAWRAVTHSWFRGFRAGLIRWLQLDAPMDIHVCYRYQSRASNVLMHGDRIITLKGYTMNRTTIDQIRKHLENYLYTQEDKTMHPASSVIITSLIKLDR